MGVIPKFPLLRLFDEDLFGYVRVEGQCRRAYLNYERRPFLSCLKLLLYVQKGI